MSHDGFRYEFTGRELIYFWFKKKICPRCNGMMIQRKGFNTVEGREVNSKADAFFVPNAKVKHYHYFYRCQRCNAEYTLQELANKRGWK